MTGVWGMLDGHMSIRRTVYYSGRVQGVGFRYTAEGLARGFEVSGTVRNLPDGRVELVAEGTTEEVDRFVEAVGRQMGRYITRASATEGSTGGGFDGFRIAF